METIIFRVILLISLIISLIILKSDWIKRIIPNNLIIMLVINNSILAYLDGHLLLSILHSLILFLFLVILWYYGVFGGGDVKLIVSFSLGITPNLIFYNLVFIGILGGVFIFLMFLFMKEPFKRGVPYGIPICISSFLFLLLR